MRRDKIFKIACNHAITCDMALRAMMTSETAWCWNALDFAENEPRNEQLALKFKVDCCLAFSSGSNFVVYSALTNVVAIFLISCACL